MFGLEALEASTIQLTQFLDRHLPIIFMYIIELVHRLEFIIFMLVMAVVMSLGLLVAGALTGLLWAGAFICVLFCARWYHQNNKERTMEQRLPKRLPKHETTADIYDEGRAGGPAVADTTGEGQQAVADTRYLKLKKNGYAVRTLEREEAAKLKVDKLDDGQFQFTFVEGNYEGWGLSASGARGLGSYRHSWAGWCFNDCGISGWKHMQCTNIIGTSSCKDKFVSTVPSSTDKTLYCRDKPLSRRCQVRMVRPDAQSSNRVNEGDIVIFLISW